MSRTIRYRGGQREESREHVMHHRFDGHKITTQVNRAYSERHAHPVIMRTGIRGK
jgi:hypothetical protein